MRNDAFRIEEIPESAGPASQLPTMDKLVFYFPEAQANGAQLLFRLCEFGPISEDPNTTTLTEFIRRRTGLLDSGLLTRLKTESAVLAKDASETAQAMLASVYGLNSKDPHSTADLFRDELAGTNRLRPAVGHRWLLEPGPAGLPHQGTVSAASDYVKRCAPMSGHILMNSRWIEDQEIGSKTYRQLLESDYAGKVIILVPRHVGAFIDCTVPIYLKMPDNSSRQIPPITVTLFAALDTPTASLIQFARNVAARYLLSSQDLQELARKEVASLSMSLRIDHAKLPGGSQQDLEGVSGTRQLDTLITRSQSQSQVSFSTKETAKRLYQEYEKAQLQKKDEPHRLPEHFVLSFQSVGSILILQEEPGIIA